MSVPLLVEFFNALPEDALRGGLDWPVSQSIGERTERPTTTGKGGGKARRRAAIHVFTKQVQHHYFEGTLLRLLDHDEPQTRRAAVFALGLLGSPGINDLLAAHLHDEDEEVSRLASEALWSLWFRGDNTTHSDELYRILRLRDRDKALEALNDLIERAPRFAEAYNQRAILYFRLERYDRSAADCEAVLKLNPHHFGAQAGLGQCHLRLRKHRSALRAFRAALRIFPYLDGVAETVRALENTLGEEGR
ncbi:MAG: tetratricopeptide repeat protein [Gemmataceae bacterium]